MPLGSLSTTLCGVYLNNPTPFSVLTNVCSPCILDAAVALSCHSFLQERCCTVGSFTTSALSPFKQAPTVLILQSHSFAPQCTHRCCACARYMHVQTHTHVCVTNGQTVWKEEFHLSTAHHLVLIQAAGAPDSSTAHCPHPTLLASQLAVPGQEWYCSGEEKYFQCVCVRTCHMHLWGQGTIGMHSLKYISMFAMWIQRARTDTHFSQSPY